MTYLKPNHFRMMSMKNFSKIRGIRTKQPYQPLFDEAAAFVVDLLETMTTNRSMI